MGGQKGILAYVAAWCNHYCVHDIVDPNESSLQKRKSGKCPDTIWILISEVAENEEEKLKALRELVGNGAFGSSHRHVEKQ